MQEFGIDYYEEEIDGCCLTCEQAEEGCLCHRCKCRKCFHYAPENKSCDIADKAKARKQEKQKVYKSEYYKHHKKIPQTNLFGEQLEINI